MISQFSSQRTNHHHHDRRSQAVKLFIQAAQRLDVADGFVLTPDANGKTPLDLACDQLVEARKQIISSEIDDDAKSIYNTKNDTTTAAAACESIWNVLLVLIETAYKATANTLSTRTNSSNNNNNTFPILHAAIMLKCPVPVLQHALTLYPHLAGTRNGKHGYTPLMLATVTQQSPEILCTLLQAFPAAARMTDNRTGRLPIDIAAETFCEYNDAMWDFFGRGRATCSGHTRFARQAISIYDSGHGRTRQFEYGLPIVACQTTRYFILCQSKQQQQH